MINLASLSKYTGKQSTEADSSYMALAWYTHRNYYKYSVLFFLEHRLQRLFAALFSVENSNLIGLFDEKLRI